MSDPTVTTITPVQATTPTVTVVQTAESVVETVAPGTVGKALVASRTPWGVLAAYAVSFLGARYGLGLDDASTGVVAGGAVLAGSYAMRYITSSPITGFLSRL